MYRNGFVPHRPQTRDRSSQVLERPAPRQTKNREDSAKELKIHRNTLFRKMKKLQINPPYQSVNSNQEKWSGSIAISYILKGSDFASIPWVSLSGFTALRGHILLKYHEEFLSQTHLFFLAWIVLILEDEQGIIQSQP